MERLAKPRPTLRLQHKGDELEAEEAEFFELTRAPWEAEDDEQEPPAKKAKVSSASGVDKEHGAASKHRGRGLGSCARKRMGHCWAWGSRCRMPAEVEDPGERHGTSALRDTAGHWEHKSAEIRRRL